MATYFLVAALLSFPAPQQPAATQADPQADEVRHAEELLERGDFKAAAPALADLARAHPHDAQILFDLGFTQEHIGDEPAAAKAYEEAVAAGPTLAEPRVALGLLKARSGQAGEAATLLRGAVGLSGISADLKARSLRALARLDQSTDPEAARNELAQAIHLNGQQPGDAELTATLSGSPVAAADAEAMYRHTLEQQPADPAASSELASILQHQNKLAEADAVLAPALAAHAEDPRLAAQAATLAAAEGRNTDALALLEKARSASDTTANNDALTRLYAHLLLVSGDAAKAEPLYRSLAASQPDDPQLLDDLGSTLVREQKFAEAQAVFADAVAKRTAFHDDTAWGEAAGHLAFAASRNHQPQVVLQALHARATVLPNSPASTFLEATAYDTLHRRKEAERAYRDFLAMAQGKLPDEEFEARHRLIALEHEH